MAHALSRYVCSRVSLGATEDATDDTRIHRVARAGSFAALTIRIPYVSRLYVYELPFFPPQLRFSMLINICYNKRETGGEGAEGKPHAGEESVPHRHSRSEEEV